MAAENATIPLDKGYWGSIVLSFFESTDSQMGAGRRRKRGYTSGGTGLEVELSFR